MEKTKLFIILNSLDGKQIERLIKFVDFSCRSDRADSIRSYLAAYAQSCENVKANGAHLDRPTFHSLLFPNSSYSSVQLSTRTNRVLEAVSKYLACENFISDLFETQIRYVEFLDKLHLDSLMRSELKDLHTNHISNGLYDSDYYLRKFRFERLQDSLWSRQPKRNRVTAFESIDNSLQLFFLTNKLKYVCAMINHGQVVETNGNDNDAKRTLKYIEERMPFPEANFNENLLISMYYHVYHLLVDNDHHHYRKLKELLRSFSSILEPQEADDLQRYAINFCLSRINQGDDESKDFLESCKGHYFFLTNSGALFENGKISPWDLKNIVAIRCSLGEFEWTENFIIGCAGNVLSDFKGNALNYNMGVLYFHLGDFQVAKGHFDQVLSGFQDDFYGLDSRNYLWRCYYELREFDLLDSFWQSFRMYLGRNNNISDAHKALSRDSIRQFRKFLNQLNGKPDKREQGLNQLLVELQNSTPAKNKEWLKKKILQELSILKKAGPTD